MTPVVTRRRAGGFTLIEVVGALLVYSAGVIMLLSITRSLSQRLEWAALNSVITAEGQERLDSLSALAYASLPVATTTDTMTVRGISYQRRQVVTQYTPLVRQVAVTVAPVDSAAAVPSFAATVFVADPW